MKALKTFGIAICAFLAFCVVVAIFDDNDSSSENKTEPQQLEQTEQKQEQEAEERQAREQKQEQEKRKKKLQKKDTKMDTIMGSQPLTNFLIYQRDKVFLMWFQVCTLRIMMPHQVQKEKSSSIFILKTSKGVLQKDTMHDNIIKTIQLWDTLKKKS